MQNNARHLTGGAIQRIMFNCIVSKYKTQSNIQQQINNRMHFETLGNNHFGVPSSAALFGHNNTYGICSQKTTIERSYTRLYGQDRAAVVFHRLPQRAIRERWGAIHTSEQDVLKAGQNELPPAWSDVFSKKLDSDAPLPQSSPVNAELGDEDMQAYTAKMSRWIKEAFAALLCGNFWMTLQIAQISRGPVDHFRRWLMKQHYQAPMDGVPPVVSLVCVRAHKLYDDSQELLFGPMEQNWPCVYGLTDAGIRAHWCSVSVAATLTITIDYKRRVVDVVDKWPYLLAYIIYAPPKRKATGATNILLCYSSVAPSNLTPRHVKFSVYFGRNSNAHACMERSTNVYGKCCPI